MNSNLPERRFGTLTIRIDRGQCIGTANCIKVAGDVFVLDGERTCSFVAQPAEVERERLIEACGVCPVQALTVIDEQDRQIVP